MSASRFASFVLVCAWFCTPVTAQMPPEKKPLTTEQPRLIAQLGHTGVVTCLDWSPTETLLATGGTDCSLRLWHVPTGRLLWAVPVFDGSAVVQAVFSPDVTMITCVGEKGEIASFDVANGLMRWKTDAPKTAGKTDSVQVAVAHRGGVFAIATGSEVRFAEIVSAAPLAHTVKGEKGITGVALSDDGAVLVVGRTDGGVEVWDAKTGKLLHRPDFKHDENTALTLAISPDGTRVASGVFGFDQNRPAAGDENRGTIRVWAAGTGGVIQTLATPKWSVAALAFSRDGKRLASGAGYGPAGPPVGKQGPSNNGLTSVWDIGTGRRVQALAPPPQFERLPQNLTVLVDGRPQIQTKFVHVELKDPVSFVAFSRSGDTVVTVGQYTPITFWDLQSGKSQQRLDLQSDPAVDVNFYPGNRLLVQFRQYRAGCLWNLARGGVGESYTFAGLTEKDPLDSSFSAHGGWLTATHPQTRAVSLWPIGLSQLPQQLDTGAVGSTSGEFSWDGRRLLTAGTVDLVVRLWDPQTGKQLAVVPDASLEGLPHPPVGVSAGESATIATTASLSRRFSPDGKMFACACVGKPGRVEVWDAVVGRRLSRLERDGGCEQPAFSPAGDRILTLSPDGRELVVWTTPAGKVAWSRKFDVPVYSVVFAADGHGVFAATIDGNLHALDASGTVLFQRQIAGTRPPGNAPPLKPGVVGGDAEVNIYGILAEPVSKDAVLVTTCDGKVTLLDARTGRPRWAVPATESWPQIAMLPTVANRVVIKYPDRVHLYELSTGKRLAEFDNGKPDRNDGRGLERSLPLELAGVDLSPDGQFLAAANGDGSVILWSMTRPGSELCRLYYFRDNTWAVVDPNGRYDASNGGDIAGLHWVVGNEPIALSQLKERYYDPGLLGKHLGINKEPLREVAAFTAPKMYPDIVATTTGAKIDVALTNRGGGIGRVVVLVNGKEASSDARPRGADPEAAKLTVQLDLSNDPRLEPGKKNRVEILAYNAEGYLCSRGMVREIEPEGEKKADPPELWAVIVGVSDYRGDAIDLKFAAKDADDFATAVRVAGNRLFGADHVHLTKLTTAGDVKAYPNRANILLAMEALKKAKPNDVMVIYLAGHGVNYGGADGDFYYLTSDAATANLADPAVRSSTAVSSKELTELLKLVPAQKQVLILDTCASGKLVEKLMEKRDVPGSQVRAMEQLKDRTGMYVLAGCASDAVSYEASRYGQGLLTYSLLLGMRGGALKDERVDVATLFGFAADKVPELARDIGGVQRPVIATPRGGQPFPIGVVTAKDQPDIPLQTIRPMLLRCNLQEEDEFKDVLDLGKKVDEVLKSATGRGKTSPLVFIDASELPGAHQLAGRYRIDGDTVVVTAILFRGKERVGRVSVKGDKGKPAELAASLAAEVEKALATTK